MKFFKWFQKKDRSTPLVRQKPASVGKVRIGDAVLRVEDEKLITGAGRYVDDVPLKDPLYITFIRANTPNGKITSLDLEEAKDLDNVISVFSGKDVRHLGKLKVNPILEKVEELDYPILADGHVEAVGQPIAAIAASTSQIGQDAAELVIADIDPSDTVRVSLGSVDDGTPNVLGQSWQTGNVDDNFSQADHVVEVEIQHPRLAPSPMENRAIAVEYCATDKSVLVYLSTQTPHRAKSELARILNIPAEKINVIAPDVGGAFGMKASLYPEEVFTVWAAFELKRSVKWISTRNEDLLSATHGRGLKTKGSLALNKDGQFLALKAEAFAPVGHWLPNSAAIPAWNAMRMLPGPYKIDALDLTTNGIKLHTAPVGIYRGAGRPEAVTLIERLVDEAARKTGLDPVALRLQNFRKSEDLDQKTITGAHLDSGHYANLFNDLINSTDYFSKKKKIEDTADQDILKGLGLSFYIEPCGQGWESATVTLNPDGTVSAATGGSSQGHGRETAFRQILSDTFGVEFDKITLAHGNSQTCPEGIGALASRSTAIGGSALLQAAQEVLNQTNGNLHPSEAVTASVRYENEGEAWGYGAYLAEISIETLTGQLSIDQITCIDDAGTIINPMMVEGQIHGGIAQGVGEALMEQIQYSDDGQLLTGSFMDYAMPRAADMPDIHISKQETPSPKNLLGAKGVGEAGTIATPVAILNAVHHALRNYSVTELQMPLTSEKIWRALQSSQEEATT